MNTLVVTGASSGIGLACAELFSEAGWQVLNISRRPCPLSGVQNFPVDLTQASWELGIGEALTRPLSAAKRLCLIHAAALHDSAGVAELDPDHLRAAFEVSVVAPVKLVQLLLPHMKPGSSILYLGSTLSEKAVAGVAAYVAVKHAVVGLMRSTCQDLSPRGIHTACICPGFTDTEMLRHHLKDDVQAIEAVKRRVAAHRLIEPAEVARLLHFCAENPLINGSVLHANLGQIEQ